MNTIIQANKKSNTKRPLEGTGEGNAKKSKRFHPSLQEISTSGIEINLTTPVVQGKGERHGEKEVMVEVNAEEVYGEEV